VHPQFFLDFEKRNPTGSFKGARIIINSRTDHPSQQWQFDPAAHSIKSVEAEHVVDIGSANNGPHCGSDLILWPWRNSPNQWWTYDPATKIIACNSHNLVMDIGGARFRDGAGVCAWRQNDKPQQKWEICEINVRAGNVPSVERPRVAETRGGLNPHMPPPPLARVDADRPVVFDDYHRAPDRAEERRELPQDLLNPFPRRK
jgi:hypothetical protein